MRFIETGKKEGGTVVLGGERHGKEGGYIQPTIFTDIDESATIARNEGERLHLLYAPRDTAESPLTVFGAVVIINTFTDEAEALQRANDTEHGLYAAVFTRDINKALRCARRVRLCGSSVVSPIS